MPYPLKGISLPYRQTFGPSDPNRWSDVAHYVTHGARCHFVRLWLDWSIIDPDEVNPDWTVQWGDYNAHVEFQYLDEVIADMNQLGIYVMLGNGQYSPTWATGVTADEPGTGKKPTRAFPTNVSVGSPWERFLTYAYNRYRPNVHAGGGFYNPTGPNPSNPFGNPRQAHIDCFGIVNEPNLEHWQGRWQGSQYQSDTNLAACTAAAMMMTMEQALVYWDSLAGMPGCALLAPDLADAPDENRGGYLYSRDYLQTANQILSILANWRPRQYWAWSHHNYTDIRNYTQARENAVVQALYNNNWRGAGDRNVWITEGGAACGSGHVPNFDPPYQQEQVNKLSASWNAPHRSEIQLWTQHAGRNKLNSISPVDGTTTGLTTHQLTNPPFQQLASAQTFADMLPRRY